MILRILVLLVLIAFPMIGEACIELVAELSGGLAPADFITIDGDIAIVSSGWLPSAWVVNISDPELPVVMGALPVAPSAGVVVIEGGYAYVAVWHDDERPDGLSIVSLGDPLAPVEVGFLPLEVAPADVAVQWPYAFVVGKSSSSSGLVVIDVRADWMPIRVSMVTIGYDPRSITVNGDYAYVHRRGCPWAVPECGPSFQVVDVSVASDPVLLGVSWGGGAIEPAFRDGFILGWTPYGLGAIDCRNPWVPEHVHLDYVYPSPLWNLYALALGEKMAYATTYQGLTEPLRSGLYIYDILNPAWPRKVHRHEIPGRGTGIAVSGDHAFVAAGEAGVVVYDVSACGLPTPRRSGGRVGP